MQSVTNVFLFIKKVSPLLLCPFLPLDVEMLLILEYLYFIGIN